jgi:hypothetical protein
MVDSLIYNVPRAKLKSVPEMTLKSYELMQEYSKSYVYVTNGLSDDRSDASPSRKAKSKHYNSLYFERDIDFEQYKQNIKKALIV